MRSWLGTRRAALISVFAALIVVVNRLPGVPIVGTSGRIELSLLLYPVAGILLGAAPGVAAALMGNLVSWLIPSTTILGLLFIAPGVVAAVVAGLLSSKRNRREWVGAAMLIMLLNLLWYASPVGFEAPFYPVLHWLALAMVLLFRGRIAWMVGSKVRREVLLGVVLCSYPAIMADSMTGNLLFILAVGWVVPLKSVLDAVAALGMLWVKLGVPRMPLTGLPGLFMGVLALTAIERTVATVASSLITVGVVRILGKTRIS